MTCIGMPNCSPFVLRNMEAEAILRLDAQHEKRVHPSGTNTSQTPMSCLFLRVTNVIMQYFCNSLSAVLYLSLPPKWFVLDTAWCSSFAAGIVSLYSPIQRQIGKIFRDSLGDLRPTGAIEFLRTGFMIERSWSLTVHLFLFLCTPYVAVHRLHLSHPSQPSLLCQPKFWHAACLFPSLRLLRSCSSIAVKATSHGLTLYTVVPRAFRLRPLGPDDGSKGTLCGLWMGPLCGQPRCLVPNGGTIHIGLAGVDVDQPTSCQYSSIQRHVMVYQGLASKAGWQGRRLQLQR